MLLVFFCARFRLKRGWSFLSFLFHFFLLCFYCEFYGSSENRSFFSICLLCSLWKVEKNFFHLLRGKADKKLLSIRYQRVISHHSVENKKRVFKLSWNNGRNHKLINHLLRSQKNIIFIPRLTIEGFHNEINKKYRGLMNFPIFCVRREPVDGGKHVWNKLIGQPS